MSTHIPCMSTGAGQPARASVEPTRTAEPMLSALSRSVLQILLGCWVLGAAGSSALAQVAPSATGAATPPSATTQGGSNRAVLPQWRNTAQRVAQAGVPLDALAANAPDSHTVKPGDTLWGISSLFLKSAWRWPELWGMNLDTIRNLHLI